MPISWTCSNPCLSSLWNCKHQKPWSNLLRPILITKLWVTINNNGLLTQQLSEYMKVPEVVIVLRLNLWKMNTLFHSCICEKQIVQSIGQYLNTIIRMFAQEFLIQKNSLIMRPIQVGKIKKCKLVLPFKTLCLVS